MTLADRVLAGDPRAMARAISLIENEAPEATDLVRAIFGHTGRAYLIGVTGPPGAGEVGIVRTAGVSSVTLVPGAGDEVQALKAGIMEIADIFVVNKADREGADRLASAIEANQSLQSSAEGEWRPPILKTVATSG